MGVASMYKKKSEVCAMKKIILPVIAQFVVLGGLMSSNFVSGVAAEELAVKTLNGVSYLSGGFGKTNARDFAASPRGTI